MAQYYLDTNAIIDFQYEEDLFCKGYVKPGKGLEKGLPYYDAWKDILRKPQLNEESDHSVLQSLFGNRDSEGKCQFDYIREIKDYCMLKELYLHSSYFAYHEYMKHMYVYGDLERILEDIPFRMVERKITGGQKDLLEREFKFARDQNHSIQFNIPEPLEGAFKWHEAGLGMGIIDKVENEKVDFQNPECYTFISILLNAGFSLLDAIQLYICHINNIEYFVSLDRYFSFVEKMKENGIKIKVRVISSYRELYAQIVKNEGEL
jgi:hypothetical protein